MTKKNSGLFSKKDYATLLVACADGSTRKERIALVRWAEKAMINQIVLETILEGETSVKMDKDGFPRAVGRKDKPDWDNLVPRMRGGA